MPGQLIMIGLPNGSEIEVEIPPDTKPGESFEVVLTDEDLDMTETVSTEAKEYTREQAREPSGLGIIFEKGTSSLEEENCDDDEDEGEISSYDGGKEAREESVDKHSADSGQDQQRSHEEGHQPHAQVQGSAVEIVLDTLESSKDDSTMSTSDALDTSDGQSGMPEQETVQSTDKLTPAAAALSSKWRCSWCTCSIKETSRLYEGPNGPDTLCDVCGKNFKASRERHRKSMQIREREAAVQAAAREQSQKEAAALQLEAVDKALQLAKEQMRNRLAADADREEHVATTTSHKNTRDDGQRAAVADDHGKREQQRSNGEATKSPPGEKDQHDATSERELGSEKLVHPRLFYETLAEEQADVLAKELPSLLESGEVSAQAQVWTEGLEDWMPLAEAQLVLEMSALRQVMKEASMLVKRAYLAQIWQYQLGKDANDSEQSGCLDAQGLHDTLLRMGFSPDEFDTAFVMDQIDTNRDSVVDYAEFCAWFFHLDSELMLHYATAESENDSAQLSDVQALIAAGKIGPVTHVWMEGMLEWQPLREAQRSRGAVAQLLSSLGSAGLQEATP